MVKINRFKKTKYFVLALGLILTLSLPAFAEKRIAVLPFDVPDSRPDMKQFGVGITDTITIALGNVKEYIMIDRSQLQNILKEQTIQHSGFIDSEKAVKLGKLMGAEVLIIGAIQHEGATYRITARLTEVESGKIIKAVQVTGNSIFDLQDKLAFEIIGQIDCTLTDKLIIKMKKIINATRNVNAYDLYIKGRNEYLLFTQKGYEEAISLFDKALQLDQNYTLALASKAEAQALLSSELEVNGKPYKYLLETAEINANQAIKQNDELGDVHRALSTIYKLQGRFEDGKKEAQEAIEMNPNDADAYYLLWANSQGKLDDPVIQKAITLNPYIIKKHLAIGYAYFKQKKFQEAISVYQELIKVNPDFIMAYVGLGYAYDQIEDFDNAAKAFQDAVSLKDSVADGHAGLGYIYFRKGKIKESIAEFKKAITINPNYSFAHGNLGYVYFETGKKEEAFKEFQTAIQINPDNFYARNGIGYYYYDKGEYEKALDQFWTALGTNYKDTDAHYNIALVYKAKGQINEAITVLKDSVRIDPNYVRAYKKLGEIYTEQGKLEDALLAYNNVLKLKPNDLEVLNNIGLIFYKQGKFNKAIEKYTESLRIEPENVNTHNNLGSAFLSMGKINEAIAEYSEALRLSPDDLNANENMAIAYEKLGKIEQASFYYDKVCRIGKRCR